MRLSFSEVVVEAERNPQSYLQDVLRIYRHLLDDWGVPDKAECWWDLLICNNPQIKTIFDLEDTIARYARHHIESMMRQ